jgi:ribulose 1,5-bisphosphate synthetase/thiazole synthase
MALAQGKVQQHSTVMKHHREAERGKVLARRFDYVIVGAGSAGCVVARRLLDGTDATILPLKAVGPERIGYVNGQVSL